jgi:hypothetical protein
MEEISKMITREMQNFIDANSKNRASASLNVEEMHKTPTSFDQYL